MNRDLLRVDDLRQTNAIELLTVSDNEQPILIQADA